MTPSDDVRDQLERGSKEPIAKVVALVKRIHSHYKSGCTEREAAAAAGWTNSGGSSSRFFQGALAYGLLNKTSGSYGVTGLGKQIVIGEITEDTIQEFLVMADSQYGVLEREQWQHLDAEDLLRKYMFRDVRDAEVRVTAYMAFRPVWAAARAGDLDEFTRLLNSGAALPSIRQRARRSAFNDHVTTRGPGEPTVPREAESVPAPSRSLVPAVPAALPDTVVKVRCQHCTGTGWVMASTR